MVCFPMSLAERSSEPRDHPFPAPPSHRATWTLNASGVSDTRPVSDPDRQCLRQEKVHLARPLMRQMELLPGAANLTHEVLLSSLNSTFMCKNVGTGVGVQFIKPTEFLFTHVVFELQHTSVNS